MPQHRPERYQDDEASPYLVTELGALHAFLAARRPPAAEPHGAVLASIPPVLMMPPLAVLAPAAAGAYAGLTFPRFRRRLAAPSEKLVAVGAALLGRPVGLALGWHRPGEDDARILSVGVLPAYRGGGLGTALLARLEAELARRGARHLETAYRAGQPATPAAEALLRRLGWDAPRPYRLVCVCHINEMIRAPFMRDLELPEGFELFPWTALTASEEALLRAQAEQEEPPWEKGLGPFIEGMTIEPTTSLGLRYRGEVVGWLLNDRVAPDTIRYQCLYVAHGLRRRGVGVMLSVASMQAHHRAVGGRSPSERGVWQTLASNRPMAAFIRRRMRPYLHTLDEEYTAAKQLAAGRLSQQPVPHNQQQEKTHV